MKLIVGLGNPGLRYAPTRHNAGFAALDALAKRLDTTIERENFRSFFGEARLGGEKILLLKPQTFMNLSGEAVRMACDFYKLDVSDVLVCYDDMDLVPGDMRFRKNGSGGGHNGMSNIISHLGTQEIARLKLGIGRPVFGNSADYVLQTMTGEVLSDFCDMASRGAVALEFYLKNGIAAAANEYNRK